MKPTPLHRFRAGLWLIPLVFSALLNTKAAADSAPVDFSVKKIWDQGVHNAFTDLVYFNGRWFSCFREGLGHNRDKGNIRVIESDDGEVWKSAAFLIGAEGVDLRDPKFCVTPDGRLMLVIGGSVLEDGNLVEKHSLVTFSPDGRSWKPLRKVLEPNHWLWRVTWHQGEAYGYAYLRHEGRREGFLVHSRDGETWRYVRQLDIPHASEATIRFLDNHEMILLGRTQPPGNEQLARIGTSRPPYTEWKWKDVPYSLGGPNFIILPDGRWIAGSRFRDHDGGNRWTGLAWMTRETLTPFLKFDSGGDNSYPGLVWHQGELWVSFYSSHEGKTSIYLARVKINEQQSR